MNRLCGGDSALKVLAVDNSDDYCLNFIRFTRSFFGGQEQAFWTGQVTAQGIKHKLIVDTKKIFLLFLIVVIALSSSLFSVTEWTAVD